MRPCDPPSYNYDDANRPTGLDNRTSPIGSLISSYAFTLDNNGNRTGSTQTEPLSIDIAAASTAFTMNAQKNRLLQAGSTSFTYDNEGQLATKTGESYVFDDAHRVVSISGTVPCQFRYDGAGNRLEATRNGVTTRYLYDAAGNLLAEADGSNSITRYYIHGAGLMAMVTSGNQLYAYHFDGTGHTVAMTNDSTQIVNTYAYTPFGTIGNQQEAIPQPFKYVGQYGVMSEENGLYYMRARYYYDPSVGRFISEDPLGFEGGNVNLTVYVSNNPINFSDPLGLKAVESFDPGVDGYTVPSSLIIAGESLMAAGGTMSYYGATAIAAGGPAGWVGGGVTVVAGSVTFGIGAATTWWGINLWPTPIIDCIQK